LPADIRWENTQTHVSAPITVGPLIGPSGPSSEAYKKEIEEVVKKNYQDAHSMKDADFQKMLDDGCDICHKICAGSEQRTEMPIDLLLREHPVPLMVVQIIYNMYKQEKSEATESEVKPTPLQIAVLFKGQLQHLIHEMAYDGSKLSAQNSNILHVVHSLFKPSVLLGHENGGTLQNDLSGILLSKFKGAHKATHYYEEGISFRVRELGRDAACSILDVSFDCGTLYIPKLTVNKKTIDLLKTFILFESQGSYGTYVTSYVGFLSRLIKDERDLDLLSKKGIITSNCFFEKVMSMIGDLISLVETTSSGGYLEEIYQSLDEYYYKNRIRKYLVLTRRKLNPCCLITSAVTAITVLGTIYGILRYYK
jgi:Plant protein of unknown function